MFLKLFYFLASIFAAFFGIGCYTLAYKIFKKETFTFPDGFFICLLFIGGNLSFILGVMCIISIFR